MSHERQSRAWIEVRSSDLRRNVATVRERVGPDVRLIPMVKADAYGLGMARAVAALEPLRPWAYGVATVAEGQSLRHRLPARKILVFSPIPPNSYRAAVEAELIVCVSSSEALRKLAAAAEGRPAQFHLEVDTGMGRAGFDWRSVSDWSSAVDAAQEAGLVFSGCFTHFHSADLEDVTKVRRQWERFQDALRKLPRPSGPFVVHACNSAAALRLPEYAADAVRLGIFLYGGRAGVGLPRPYRPVAVRARVVHVRQAPPGTTVGYGATHTAAEWERWATVGIGYGDGLPRALGNRGSGLIHGKRARVVGRISMDMTVVDITGHDAVEPGDRVTFLGRDGDEEITLEEIADLAGTINYEILTGFTARLPRIWIEDGRN
jgi:alanine racemase